MKRQENWMKWDLDSRMNPKTAMYFAEHGCVGYGFLIFLIETMYRQAECKLLLSEVQVYAKLCKIEETAAEQFIASLVALGLFESDKCHFWSPRVIEEVGLRQQAKEAESARKSKAAQSRWQRDSETHTSSSTAMHEHSQASRGDQSRVEQTRVRADQITEEEGDPPTLGSSGESGSKKSSKPWPPPGVERAPYVFLTDEQEIRLSKRMTVQELRYWLEELSARAQQNPIAWKKRYRDHELVVIQWQRMKIERGFVWDEIHGHYRLPNSTPSKGNLQNGVKLLARLKFEEEGGSYDTP